MTDAKPERESERERQTDGQKGSEREGEEGLITVHTNESINKIIRLLAVVEPEATAGTGTGTTVAADAAEGTSEKREPEEEEEVVLAVAVENIDADAGNSLEGWSLVEGEGFHKASSGVGREAPCYSWSEWCHRSQAENQRWDTASPNVVDDAVVVGTVRGKGAEQVLGRSFERGPASRRQQGVAQVGETKRSETLQLNAADC